MQEMIKTSNNPTNHGRNTSSIVYEIASPQGDPSTRTTAPSSQHANIPQSANYANSPESRGQMETPPSGFESRSGYINAGQDNEYEQLDVSNSPQNDYHTLTGV